MERAARIIGVWIVTCLVGGGVLVIANVPTIGQPTDQELWLIRLGVFAIFGGILGLVAETFVLLRPRWLARTRRRRNRRAGLGGNLTATVFPGSVSPTLPQHSFGTTGERNRAHELGHRPQAIHFSQPEDRIVRHADLPCRIPCGHGSIVVQNFYALGVVIDEDGTVGDPVAFVSYPMMADPPPLKPVEPAPWAGQILSATGGAYEISSPILPPAKTDEPTLVSDAKLGQWCTTYIDIGEQLASRIGGLVLETPASVWAEQDRKIHAYLNEVLVFLHANRPKYWQRLKDRLREPTHEKLIGPIQELDEEGNVTGTYIWGHGDALRERIGRVVKLLREILDET